MTELFLEYGAGYNHDNDAWNKRAHAEKFATFMAAEFGVHRKGVEVEKDGPNFRIRLPLVSVYWEPRNAAAWPDHFEDLRQRMKTWASS